MDIGFIIGNHENVLVFLALGVKDDKKKTRKEKYRRNLRGRRYFLD